MCILHYRFKVLEDQKAFGIERIGSPKWQLVLCLISVFVVVYFALWKGIKSSGKVCAIEKKEKQKEKYMKGMCNRKERKTEAKIYERYVQ